MTERYILVLNSLGLFHSLRSLQSRFPPPGPDAEERIRHILSRFNNRELLKPRSTHLDPLSCVPLVATQADDIRTPGEAPSLPVPSDVFMLVDVSGSCNKCMS